MKLRLGAALLCAALMPLSPVVPASAGTEVDITAPEVGSCHAYTMEQGAGDSDHTPEVSCSEPHTALTLAVHEFDGAPDWSDPDTITQPFRDVCFPAYVDALGGNVKVIMRSAHQMYVFIPTRAQRDAGAAWIRCDVALNGGTRLLNLPDGLALDGLPLPDSVAKCRAGERADYAYTACSQPHKFRAEVSIKYPHSTYPGVRAAKRFALRKCRERARAAFFYEAVYSRWAWQHGYRYAVCLFTNDR